MLYFLLYLHTYVDAGDDRVTIGKKRNLVISNSSDKKKPTKHVRRSTPITDEESESSMLYCSYILKWYVPYFTTF